MVAKFQKIFNKSILEKSTKLPYIILKLMNHKTYKTTKEWPSNKPQEFNYCLISF